jgi:protein ImuB
LPARVGIAASKLAARVAAELPKSPNVVAPGEEGTFLAPLPLARLSPELEAAAMLQRFGLSSIGDLARLPESEIASRLGEVGRELHWAARGIDPRPLMPRAFPPEFREGMELEWPLVALEPFLFIANAALDRLAKRMEIQGFACKRLEFTLTLDPDGYDARGIDLPAPTRDVKTMLTLMRLALEKTPPGAPVVGFLFVAHPDRPRRAQLSLFGPNAMSPEKLATTIAKLVAILGDGRVGMPMTVDGHLPERFAISDFDPPPPPDVRRTPSRARGLLAVRTFRPPIAIEVTTCQTSDKEIQIASIRSIPNSYSPLPTPHSPKRIEVGATIEISGTVRICSGPWRIEEGWWSERPEVREYWDVELERGGIYRLFRGVAEEWFVDARYEM